VVGGLGGDGLREGEEAVLVDVAFGVGLAGGARHGGDERADRRGQHVRRLVGREALLVGGVSGGGAGGGPGDEAAGDEHRAGDREPWPCRAGGGRTGQPGSGPRVAGRAPGSAGHSRWSQPSTSVRSSRRATGGGTLRSTISTPASSAALRMSSSAPRPLESQKVTPSRSTATRLISAGAMRPLTRWTTGSRADRSNSPDTRATSSPASVATSMSKFLGI